MYFYSKRIQEVNPFKIVSLMNEAERLEQYRVYKKIPKKEFVVYTGYSTINSLHAILNGNKPISMKVIRNLASNCPDLNLKWLLTGKGKMLYIPDKIPTNLEKAYLERVEEISALKSEIINLLKQKNQILEPVS